MCFLCGFVCCGGKSKDDLQSRKKANNAVRIIFVSQAISSIMFVGITLTTGGSLGYGPLEYFFIFYLIFSFLSLWWVMDTSKWLNAKVAA